MRFEARRLSRLTEARRPFGVMAPGAFREKDRRVSMNAVETMSFTIYAGLTVCFLTMSLIVLAALSDLRSMRIGNLTSALIALAYIAAIPIAVPPIHAIGSSITTAAFVLICGVILFCRGLLGGGDVKFAASLMLWAGADHAIEFLFWTAALGGIFGLFLLAFRTLPAPRVDATWVHSLHKSPAMPLAVPLAGAALFVLPKSGVFNTLLLPFN